ncbi:hypothetical protein EH223_08455 [candidate division KSB1 bacterium]|nr:MAG: hypothetical protein EH223_08455 [candidate division KSB1 bacterium]
MLSDKERAALERAAAAVGVPFDWLYRLIRFETAGTFDPLKGNPNSSAIGLLQFTNAAARDLGYNSSQELAHSLPTFEAQVAGAVIPYLKRYRPFPTPQSLYMSVFYPAARFWPENREFPPAVQKANTYATGAIKTVRDYVRRVEGGISSGLAAALILLASIVAGILYYK